MEFQRTEGQIPGTAGAECERGGGGKLWAEALVERGVKVGVARTWTLPGPASGIRQAPRLGPASPRTWFSPGSAPGPRLPPPGLARGSRAAPRLDSAWPRAWTPPGPAPRHRRPRSWTRGCGVAIWPWTSLARTRRPLTWTRPAPHLDPDRPRTWILAGLAPGPAPRRHSDRTWTMTGRTRIDGRIDGRID